MEFKRLAHSDTPIRVIVAGAHPYPIERSEDDPFQSKEVNYHYLIADVAPQRQGQYAPS